MVDLKVDNNHRGLIYILADYAKSVNGGKDIKISSKQWQKTMEIVAEINSKRSADNAIYSGGSNLYGNINENFILTKNTISFSNDEIIRILKEMGVNTENLPASDDAGLLSDFKPVKGLSIEHAADSDSVNSNITQSEKLEALNESLNDFNKYPALEYLSSQMKAMNYSQQIDEMRVVTAAKDTTNLAPPFEIKIPKTGKLGGNTKTISHEFHTKLMKLADELNCTYEDLITVMNFESGLDPNEGAGSKYKPVGLIQFTSNTIEALNQKYSLNLTKEAVAKMSAEEQIDLVEKYLKMCKESAPRVRNKKKLDAADLYSLIILPARAGKDILCQEGEKNSKGKLLNYYESNKGIDVSNDGVITRADVLAKLDEFRVNVKVV